MESSLFLLFFLSFTLLLQLSCSETILVDGLAVWKNPNVLVGDTIIFKHKQHYNLYIFHTRRAFKHCNFTQAVLLTDPKSHSFTWHPSRLGVFYFTFNNGSLKNCQESQKFPIRVSENEATGIAPSPTSGGEGGVVITTPPPTSGGGGGGVVITTPPPGHFPLSSPSPAPMEPISAPSVSMGPISTVPTTPATTSPYKGGGIPFINSNPAVPLPTEADAATIHPMPINGNVGQVVGWLPFSFALMVWAVFFT